MCRNPLWPSGFPSAMIKLDVNSINAIRHFTLMIVDPNIITTFSHLWLNFEMEPDFPSGRLEDTTRC